MKLETVETLSHAREESTPAWQVRFLAALALSGNVSAAAKDSGVSRATAYRTRRQDREFFATWDKTVEEAVDALELEARRRAVEGVERPIVKNGVVVATVRDYSDVLLMFLLRAHRPRKYRERTPLPVEVKEQTPESHIEFEKVLEAAGYQPIPGGVADPNATWSKRTRSATPPPSRHRGMTMRTNNATGRSKPTWSAERGEGRPMQPGDELTELELDQAEALDPGPEIAAKALGAGELVEALDQARPPGPTKRTRKPRNRGGRPSRLTIETALKLGQALGRGQSIEAAAQSAGVGVSSAYRWVARGRTGDPRFATLAAVSKEKRHWWSF